MALGVLSAPSVFGDAEWAAGVPWMVSARAEVDATAVLIDNAAYARLAQHPAIAYRLYRDACVRHMLANHTAQVMAIYDVETRLLRLLLDHGERVGTRSADALVIKEPIGPVALAAALGVNRRTITRALKTIETQGWLARDGDAWTLKRLASMEAILPPHLLGFSTTSGEHGAVFSRWSGQLNSDDG
jgi:CRP-like cAMP-binding protein